MPKGHVGKIKMVGMKDEAKGRGRPKKTEGESPKKISKSPKKKKKISTSLFGKVKEEDGSR